MLSGRNASRKLLNASRHAPLRAAPCSHYSINSPREGSLDGVSINQSLSPEPSSFQDAITTTTAVLAPPQKSDFQKAWVNSVLRRVRVPTGAATGPADHLEPSSTTNPIVNGTLLSLKAALPKKTESLLDNMDIPSQENLITDEIQRSPESFTDPKLSSENEAEKIHESAAHSVAASTSYQWPQDVWRDEWGRDELAPPKHGMWAFSKDPDPDLLRPEPPNKDIEQPPHTTSPYKDTLGVTEGLPHPTRHYSRVVQGSIKSGAPYTEMMQDLVSPTPQRPIAKLADGLDRILFNPGVHWLQDPRSRVYNFSPRFQFVPKVDDFAFDRVTGFVKSSLDDDLWALAKREKCKFIGSTSSLTGMLSHIYFLISSMKPPDMGGMTSSFLSQSNKSALLDPMFSYGQRLPVSLVLHYKDGIYATDYDPSDPGLSERNILTWMGTMLEKFLTTPQEEFAHFLRKNPPKKGPADDFREAYRYAKAGSYVMRSQLDCHDKRLPGTGVFDLKTRAALPIRMDLFNYEENSGYLIRQLRGPYESFEREYFDLIRSAFLKYSFQARIGNMDGIFAAYHNTSRIFGFQYIPLEDMDQAIFGHKDVGKAIFEKCLKMLEVISDEVTSHFPNQSITCLWDTEDDGHTTHVWIEPKDWDSAKGPKPIVQLDVTATNYVNGKVVYGHHLADALADGGDWSIQWQIKTVNLDPGRIWQNKQAAKDRQTIYWCLPAGMSKKQAQKWVEALDFGGKGALATEIKNSRFRTPDGFVLHLRSLARRGSKDTKRMLVEEAGKPKIVYGQSSLEVNKEDMPREAMDRLLRKRRKERREKRREVRRASKSELVQKDVQDTRQLLALRLTKRRFKVTPEKVEQTIRELLNEGKTEKIQSSEVSNERVASSAQTTAPTSKSAPGPRQKIPSEDQTRAATVVHGLLKEHTPNRDPEAQPHATVNA